MVGDARDPRFAGYRISAVGAMITGLAAQEHAELLAEFDTYEIWRKRAVAHIAMEGEVNEKLLAVAHDKGWLKQWVIENQKNDVVKQAKKRGRMNTVSDGWENLSEGTKKEGWLRGRTM